MIHLTTKKYNKNNSSNKKRKKKIALYELSATHIRIIQIQAHSPQNTHTHVKNVEKKRFIFSKKPIATLRPHQMKGTSQHASQPSREHARFKLTNFPFLGGGLILFFFFFFFFFINFIYEDKVTKKKKTKQNRIQDQLN